MEIATRLPSPPVGLQALKDFFLCRLLALNKKIGLRVHMSYSLKSQLITLRLKV